MVFDRILCQLIATGQEIIHFDQMTATDLLLFMVLGTISILKHIVTYGFFFFYQY